MGNFRLRLYIETTVFNWYFDPRPGHEEVVKLFEAVKAGKFIGYTSRYVIDELEKAHDPKRTDMLNLFYDCGIIMLSPKAETETLADEYINAGILPKSQKYDSIHIAVASLHGLDVIVSYNFHHINRNKTKELIPVINGLHGLRGIMFCTAEEVFSYDSDIRGGNGSD